MSALAGVDTGADPGAGIGIDAIHVVMPAHDEELLVSRALTALAPALAAVRARHPQVVVRTTVVLDRCRDHTEARVREHAVAARERLEVVAVDAACVGAARRAGVAHARTTTAYRTDRVWVASTDADSAVTPTWLLDHLALAEHHDLVVGAVRPEPGGLPPSVLAGWEQRHGPSGLHVHGANLGFRLSAYDAVGGFAAVAEHEDVGLVHALVAAGRPWCRGSEVLTSARLDGRTTGGFAGYLRQLVGS